MLKNIFLIKMNLHLDFKTLKMKKLLLSMLAVVSFWGSAMAQLPNGVIAPDFTLTDINNVTHNLYNYLAQGKRVYIDVSATWCGPCWNFHNTHALDDLWAQHGPLGQPGVNQNTTNDCIVLFIEGDVSTTNADLLGSGPNTQGDWVTGVKHPIIDLQQGSTFNNDYNIGYFPTIYMICQDKIITEVGQQSAAALYAAGSTCPTGPANANVDLVAVAEYPAPPYMCGNALNPTLKFINYSTSPITSATVNIKYNGATINTYNWSGNVAGNGVGTVTVPQFAYNAATGYNGYSWEIVAAGDVNPANNSKNLIWKVYTNSNAKVADYSEAFSGANLPNNFSFMNANSGDLIFPFAGGVNGIPQVKGPDGAASQALLFDLLDLKDPAGSFLGVVATNVDFSAKPYLTVDLDLAHANKTAQTNDKFEVIVSTDCGATWTSVWSKQGADLNNDQNLYPGTAANNIFIPDVAGDWKHISVNLNNYKSTQNLLVGLKATILSANNGNALFIDNFKISGNTPAGLTDKQFSDLVDVYPNPANEILNVNGLAGDATIQIIDIFGTVISSMDYKNIQSAVQISTNELANGNYIIKISQEGKNAFKQFVKMN